MAIVTKKVAEFHDFGNPALTCVVEFDYDNVDLMMMTLRVVNNTTAPIYGAVWRASNPQVSYSRTFLANTNNNVPVGTGAANRLQLTLTASGKLDGVNFSLRYPAQ